MVVIAMLCAQMLLAHFHVVVKSDSQEMASNAMTSMNV